jgi:cytochrome bd-type quinol oxidase subunit 2
MRFLCIIMAIFFILLTAISIVNIIIEWDGCAEHNSCAAEVSSRIKSIFLTIVLGVCAGLWIWQGIDAFINHHYKKLYLQEMENRYKLTMEANIERKQ